MNLKRYVCGDVRRWSSGDWADREAREIVSDFDGWLEGLCFGQVREIVKSIAKGLRDSRTRKAGEGGR